MQNEILVNYAMSFVGHPYLWGGKGALAGFDCSGLVVEILRAAGVRLPQTNLSAAGLYDYFRGNASSCETGALAFYGSPIDHVGFCLSEHYVLVASGGDATVVDLATAIKKNAYVKMRPVQYRPDFIACKLPIYP